MERGGKDIKSYEQDIPTIMWENVDKFDRDIEVNGNRYIVRYVKGVLSGYCEYERIEMVGMGKKKIRQEGFILVGCEMGDIIEYLHRVIGLSGEMLSGVNKVIRDHSLNEVRLR